MSSTLAFIYFLISVFFLCNVCVMPWSRLFFHSGFISFSNYTILTEYLKNRIWFNSILSFILTSIYDLPFYVFRHIILVSYIWEKVIDNHLFSIFIPLWRHETLIDHITPLPTSWKCYTLECIFTLLQDGKHW